LNNRLPLNNRRLPWTHEYAPSAGPPPEARDVPKAHEASAIVSGDKIAQDRTIWSWEIFRAPACLRA